ncbi:M15 family metallopeptidase [Fulvivirga sp. 29W222]|uniref:D-alanyl-D-alanine dipeptidase n=1 Tax=Fulvivirga marina TaxID=2494733 RepID=A0A937FTF6_9BACT|nr:M15 family metallopeptidase [Fulvivirga marina]MBL6445540.1 M15 family metallopeptidase [Fulvivirga marina]
MIRYFFVLFILLAQACNSGQKETTETIHEQPQEEAVVSVEDTVKAEDVIDKTVLYDSSFVNLKKYADGFSYDMRYATANNFLKKKVYPCAECLVRKEVAEALTKANKELTEKGFRIRFFDCYRPLDVQKAMWEIFPNAKYVANPNTSASIHNRGAAADITLEDLKGNPLDMGTTFDFFGKEAHHAYTELPDTVLANRQLLKSTMENNGFRAITTEWWHYSFKSKYRYEPSNFKFSCGQ